MKFHAFSIFTTHLHHSKNVVCFVLTLIFWAFSYYALLTIFFNLNTRISINFCKTLALYFDMFSVCQNYFDCSWRPYTFIVLSCILPFVRDLWSRGKESVCQCRRHRFHPWSGRLCLGATKPVHHTY